MNLGSKHRDATTTMGVALCCSYADLGVANEIRGWLEDRDVASDLVPDVDRDDDALVVQLMGDVGPTVYVLLASEAFGPDRVQELVREFGARRGPGHRLQIVETAGETAEQMADVIVRAVRTSVKRNSRVDLEAVGGARRGSTAPALKRRPLGDDRRDPAAPAVPRGSRPKEDPNPLRDRVGVIPASIQTFGAVPGAIRRPVADDDTRKVGGPIEEREEEATPLRAPVVSSRPAPRFEDAHTYVGGPALPETSEDLETAVADSDPLLAETESADEAAGPVAAQATRPPSRLGVAVVGVVLAVAASAGVWVYVNDGPASAPKVSVARASAAQPSPTKDLKQEGAPAERTPKLPEPAPTPTGAKGAAPPPSVPPAVRTASEGVPPAPAEDRPTQATSTARAADGDPDDPEGVLDGDDGGDLGVEPRVGDPRLAGRISAALDARRIRALDNMLFFRARLHDDVTFAEAAALCRSASIKRIRGWRLSTILELRKLRKARIIPRHGSFWSRSHAQTEEGEGEAYWTISRASHRPAPLPADEAGAQTVCVQMR